MGNLAKQIILTVVSLESIPLPHFSSLTKSTNCHQKFGFPENTLQGGISCEVPNSASPKQNSFEQAHW